MAEINFIYEGKYIMIQCNKNQKMRNICNNLSNKINIDINSLVFLYRGNIINLDKKYNEITKENKISILIHKSEIENKICPKCGRILNNKIIDNIILSNNNINDSLTGIIIQINNIMNDIINNKDNKYINVQLKNINVLINNINEDIKKINNQLNQFKYNNIKEYKKDKLKNEIICIYNKQEYEIKLLYDYNENIDEWGDEEKKMFIEGKNNINDKNIEIYINNKKISFNYRYKSNEKGNITVKFIFNKLLTSTCNMFMQCFSLESIDLSSFNASNVNDMSGMFGGCSSLKSIDLSSLNTTKVNDMSGMFMNCFSLESINLSSINTTNVKDMSHMFCKCFSLKSIDLSSFNTINVNKMVAVFQYCSLLKSLDLSSFNTINVNDMRGMFYGCSSLESINLFSFNIINVKDMNGIFKKCTSLKKENIKINNFGKKLLENIN